MKPSIYLLVEEAARAMLSKHLTVAVAESCTGGMLASAITSIPGASNFFKGGVVAYANEIKERLLGVPAAVIKDQGAVSEATVTFMAAGVKKSFDSACAMAISGVAGPDGGTAEKPVGLVYIAIQTETKKKTYRHIFTGNRQQIREDATEAALRHLLELILSKKNPR